MWQVPGGIVPDQAGHFLRRAVDGHQGGDQRDFHVGFRQVACLGFDMTAVVEQRHRLGIHLLAKARQQIGKTLAVLLLFRHGRRRGRMVRTSPSVRSTASRKSAIGTGLVK